MRALEREKIRRIVVRGTNWVGDAIMGVPALRQLRRAFPDANITLVVRSGVEGLFADTDFVDELVGYERKGPASTIEQVRLWRGYNFDMAVLFQNAFEAALIPFLARIPIRIGYATDGRRALLTDSFSAPEWRHEKHEIFYYINLITEINRLFGQPELRTSDLPDCSLQISQLRRNQASIELKKRGVRQGCITVALCPGSINSRAKRWPAERYAQLADQLIEERTANILLIGSRQESDVAAEVIHFMRHKPIDLTGRTRLDEAVAILSLVDLLITNDTGPAHIASALGRPTLVIFGPTNPLTTRPYSETAQIVRHPPDCAPCMLRDCPIDHRCMTAITVDNILTKALALLHADEMVKKSSRLEGPQTDERKVVSTLNR